MKAPVQPIARLVLITQLQQAHDHLLTAQSRLAAANEALHGDEIRRLAALRAQLQVTLDRLKRGFPVGVKI